METRRDSPGDADRPPVELAHLAVQTGGDPSLEREVLLLFTAKAEAEVARLAATTDDVERRDIAHSMVGSARAIGAGEVARLAAAIEAAGGRADADIAALAEAVRRAQQFIRDHLGD